MSAAVGYNRRHENRHPSPLSQLSTLAIPPGCPPQPSPGLARRSGQLAADDLRQPNGIIGTPDGKTLYVADIKAGQTYAYDIAAAGTLKRKRLFCKQGSDGMTLDSAGNVYLTGKGATVFDRSGKKIEEAAVPEPWTVNVCFGGKDRKTLFITASTGLYGLKMRVKGAGSQ
ncbi:MAG TPA: SMP-30/gluconolactonase/LRE family protein [Gemmataceae bacterium]|nr:SMP-30/gluconolactonase/LRE family protein [Gemmataceae bacterium]